MNWIYHERKKWFPDGNTAYQLVYLRAVMQDQEGEEFETKIIDIHITALDLFFEHNLFDDEEDKAEMSDIYFNKLADKKYFLEELDIPKDAQKIYLNWAKLYFREVFDRATLEQWLKVYLAILGYPCKTLKLGKFNDFSDTNSVMQLFSLENVEEFEDDLGKEWWKKGKEKEEETSFQADPKLIEELLGEIKKGKSKN